MSFSEKMKGLVNNSMFFRRIMSPLLYPRRLFLRHWMRRDPVRRNLGQLFAEPPVIRVAEFGGTFAINATSHLLFRLMQHGEYEPVLAALARLAIDPGRDVIDVGANVGFYSVLAAKNTQGRVLAVEPAPGVLTLLRANLERNQVGAQVVVYEGVAAASTNTFAMSVIAGKEEYSSLGGVRHPAASQDRPQVIQVAGSSLDSLASGNGLDVGFIKIDAEGSEPDVIDGAEELLRDKRPFILSEFSPALLLDKGRDPTGFVQLFEKAGYRVFDPIAPNRRVGQRPYGDLFAVPEEKLSAREALDLLWESRSAASREAVDRVV